MCLCTYQKKDKNTEFVIGTLVIKAAWLTWGCSYVTSDQWCYSPLPDSPFTSYLAPHTESLCAKARAISPLTATLSVCVCAHPCATITSIVACVFVCLSMCVRDIPLTPFLFQGHWWSVEVKSYKSPHPPPSLHSTPPPPPSLVFSTCPHAHPERASWGLRSHSYLEPGLLLRVCSGWEAVEGNYSSALIGIIILAGWQRWITQQDAARQGRGCWPGGHDRREDKRRK